jgi:hypothetical protein
VKPRRGEIWTIGGQVPITVLVVSGNVYNDLPDPHVIAMEVTAGKEADVTVVDVGEGRSVLIDTIGRVPKRLFARLVARIDTQRLTDVHISLFRIIATN